jgi:hypothetical protein
MTEVSGHLPDSPAGLGASPSGAQAGERPGFFRDYASRHTNGWNRALHVIGVPIAPVFFLGFLVTGRFTYALGAFVIGYTLQWIGHRIEGNGMADSLEGKLVAAMVAPFRRRGANG